MELKPLSPDANDEMTAAVRREVAAVTKSQGGAVDAGVSGIEEKRNDAWPPEDLIGHRLWCIPLGEAEENVPDKDISARV